MRRAHLFELEDQPWWPGVLRDAMTAYLSQIMALTNMLDPLMPKVLEAAERSGAERIIDLCSGAGGPGSLVAAGLAGKGSDLRVHCTDLFPNQAHLQATADASNGRLTFEARPVDATSVPDDLVGLRTIFNALHHMPPDLARQILADAHDKGQPIAVFELVDRRLGNLVGLPFLPFFVALLLPTIRPFDWRWIPLTYLLPIIPLAVWWDGFVSMMRIYQPDELQELVVGLDDYDWDIGRIQLDAPGIPIYATYLVGMKKELASAP